MLDLDALERWANHELEAYSTRTNTDRLADIPALIKRLREAEAAMKGMTVAQKDLNYELALDRIAQLERVREAADYALSALLLGAEFNSAEGAAYGLDDLATALAAVEEKQP